MRRSGHWNMNCSFSIRRFAFFSWQETCWTYWGVAGHKSTNWDYFKR